MPETTHSYHSAVEWTGAKQGTASLDGRPDIPIGAPPEFGGDQVSWSPEHLCVAAVNACLMAAFAAVAEHSKVPFASYTAQATGDLEKVEGRGFVFTRILVRPRIVVPASVDRTKVEQVVRLAKRSCFISNSLTAEVVVEPEITTA